MILPSTRYVDLEHSRVGEGNQPGPRRNRGAPGNIRSDEEVVVFVLLCLTWKKGGTRYE